VADVRVDISSQELQHTKQENHSLNGDKWTLRYNAWFFIKGKSLTTAEGRI
jgi:hypothetical protein